MSRVEMNVGLFWSPHLRYGLVAVSGGADSVALLRALVTLGKFDFMVVHANHKLRCNESDPDEAFVKELPIG